ncbi:hypothetical protein [Streptomyces sp. NPDC102462]|uniref:hypothetical protein n=1 Tax=Streptomyces sp. NPDC102462 TaxID=3366178 RepID=UPI003804E9F8
MTIGEQSNAALLAEDDFPDHQQVVQRFGDLAPDGTTSTVALSRLFEHPRVGLRFSRFDKLTAEATIVLADKSGPITLPDELLADLEQLQLPETGTAVASK